MISLKKNGVGQVQVNSKWKLKKPTGAGFAQPSSSASGRSHSLGRTKLGSRPEEVAASSRMRMSDTATGSSLRLRPRLTGLKASFDTKGFARKVLLPRSGGASEGIWLIPLFHPILLISYSSFPLINSSIWLNLLQQYQSKRPVSWVSWGVSNETGRFVAPWVRV